MITPAQHNDSLIAAHLDRQRQADDLIMEISRKLHDSKLDNVRYLYIGYQQIGILQSDPRVRLEMTDSPKLTLYGIEVVEVHKPQWIEVG